MSVMSAKDAKNRFGELLLEAQREPVTIEKNGKPVAVVRSYDDDQEIERMKLERLRGMIAEGLAEVERGEVFEMNDDLRELILRDGPSPLDD